MLRRVLFLLAVSPGFLLSQNPGYAQLAHPLVPQDLPHQVYEVRKNSVFFYSTLRTDPTDARPHLYRMDFATSRVSRLLPDETEDRLLGGACSEIAASCDGMSLAVVTAIQEGAEQANRILLVDTRTSAVREIVANGKSNSHPQFSPDGRHLCFLYSVPEATASASKKKHVPFGLAVANLADGKITQLVEEPCHWAFDSGPCWSPDGETLVYCSSTGSTTGSAVSIIARSGGMPRRISPRGAQFCSHARWLANGLILYYAIGESGVPGLCTIKTDGTCNRPVFRGFIASPPDVAPDGHRICFEGIPLDSPNQRRAHLVLINSYGDLLLGHFWMVFQRQWRM